MRLLIGNVDFGLEVKIDHEFSDASLMLYKISHREVGQGPVLVLLHGYGGNIMHWSPIVEKLKSNFRLVIPNITRLYMTQDRIFFSIQVEILADYLRQHFPKEKLHIAGTSYGGALAWALSLNYPDIVDRLILINPMIAFPTRHFKPPEIRYFCTLPLSQNILLQMLSTPIGKAFLKRMAQAFRSERFQGPLAVANLRDKKLVFVGGMIHRFTWILRNEDWSYWIKKAQARGPRDNCLIVYDKDDFLFSATSYLEFAEIFGCHLTREIQGGGHLAIRTRPEALVKIINHFIPAQMAA